jgi:hypothetical protein
MAHGGQPIGYVGLGVALAAVAAECTGSPGSTGLGPAASAVAPSLLISRTAPHAPVGRQLTWFLRAADLGFVVERVTRIELALSAWE